MRNRPWAGLLPAVLLFVGCASGGGGGGISDPSEIRRDMGRATYPDVVTAVNKILEGKYRFAIQRFEENYNNIWFETEWQVSDPMEDERAQGLSRVRTRLVMDGRRGPNETFRLRMTASIQYRLEGSQVWERFPVTEMREEVIDRILIDMDMEIRAGVRTIG